MESYKGAVHTGKDAIMLLEAARTNLIPRVTRRLKEQERSMIKAGNVFIWNEKEAKMRRWTDGRSWSASRVTGSFLTYREMESNNYRPNEGNIHNYEYKTDGLIKQSFSLTTQKGDKLHLISYTTTGSFSDSKFNNKTPSTDPAFSNIQIPKDLYPESSLNESSSGPEKVTRRRSSAASASPSMQTTSPVPSPLSQTSVNSVPTPLRLTSPILNANVPRILIEDSTPDSNSIATFVPRLPPLRQHASIAQSGRTNFTSRNYIGHDTVALHALDRFSFNF
jgi:hypothetical protein